MHGHDIAEPIANLKKQAVLDPVLFNNKNYMKSLAEFKHIWAGSGPQGDMEDSPMKFLNQDLVTWFRMYNQTQLENAKKYLATKGTEDEAALVLAQQVIRTMNEDVKIETFANVDYDDLE